MGRRKTLTPDLRDKSAAWYVLLRDIDKRLVPVGRIRAASATAYKPPGNPPFVPPGRLGKWLRTLPLELHDKATKHLKQDKPGAAAEALAKMGYPATHEDVWRYRAALAAAQMPAYAAKGGAASSYKVLTPEGWMNWAALLKRLQSSPYAATYEKVMDRTKPQMLVDDLWGKDSRPSWWGEIQRAFYALAVAMEAK